MRRRCWRRHWALLTVGILVPVGVSLAVYWPRSPIKITKDRQPAFRIDPASPYKISLYRGCGMTNSGNRIEITQDGRVMVTRSTDLRGDYKFPLKWEKGTFTIPTEARAELLRAIESNRLMELHRDYTHTDTFDGIQWGLSIKQGEREKRVACSNYFPEELVRFTKQFDTIILRYRWDVKWRPVEDQERSRDE